MADRLGSLLQAMQNIKSFLFRPAKKDLIKKITALENESRETKDSLSNILRICERQAFQNQETFEAINRYCQTVAIENLSLVKIVEERSRTLEYVANQSLYIQRYQADLILKFYNEVTPSARSIKPNVFFDIKSSLALKTEFPIAIDSNDHINPESTAEGIVRPTFFVKNCKEVLGENIKSLDLGTGAAGLVYEWAMNEVFAAGVDGSDYCKRYGVGYWPLLEGNLFTCDITKPFKFYFREENQETLFDVITMWEVLEHINETDLPQLLANIKNHLTVSGYFIGSVSLVEYNDPNGTPYHITLKPKTWWAEQFSKSDLEILDVHPFNVSYFCRGVGRRFQDFHDYLNEVQDGFHFVAKRKT